MDTLISILLFCGACYASYKVGYIGTSMFFKYFKKPKPVPTEVTETKMRVSGDAQADIIEVLNKHKMTDQQVLSTLIYLAGISVATTGAERVFVEDHARRKKYTMTVEDV